MTCSRSKIGLAARSPSGLRAFNAAGSRIAKATKIKNASRCNRPTGEAFIGRKVRVSANVVKTIMRLCLNLIVRLRQTRLLRQLIPRLHTLDKSISNVVMLSLSRVATSGGVDFRSRQPPGLQPLASTPKSTGRRKLLPHLMTRDGAWDANGAPVSLPPFPARAITS